MHGSPDGGARDTHSPAVRVVRGRTFLWRRQEDTSQQRSCGVSCPDRRQPRDPSPHTGPARGGRPRFAAQAAHRALERIGARRRGDPSCPWPQHHGTSSTRTEVDRGEEREGSPRGGGTLGGLETILKRWTVAEDVLHAMHAEVVSNSSTSPAEEGAEPFAGDRPHGTRGGAARRSQGGWPGYRTQRRAGVPEVQTGMAGRETASRRTTPRTEAAPAQRAGRGC